MTGEIKVVTYNLRVCVDDGINSWANRKQLVFDKIQDELPDVIGFQEITEESLRDLRKELKDYAFIGYGRDKDLSGEYVIFAYNKNKLDLLNLDTFWLSESPHAAGTTYENASPCPRNCTVAVFRTISDRKLVRVYDVHMDHIGSQARLKSAAQILRDLGDRQKWLNMPAIILGDFNSHPDAPEVKVFSKYNNGMMHDITEDIEYSFHNYGKTKEKIDYIFLSNGLSCVEVKLWTDCREGIYLSDHYPIAANILLE